MQRFFDIFFSATALILLSPLFIILVPILSKTGEGEIFFIQKRIGKDGRLFNLFKFATMLKNSPNIGTKSITLNADPRVLPLGFFLRKTKINELPQLINILIGDMSVIGPRPLSVENFSLYEENVKRKIITVRPGLSGVGSILFRNEQSFFNGINDPVSFYKNEITPHKGCLEVWYVENQNLRLYFSLILLTMIVVFNQDSKFLNHFYRIIPETPPALNGLTNIQGNPKFHNDK